MEKDVTDQLIQDLRNAGIFAIRLDESTEFPPENIRKEELIKLMTLSEKNRCADIMNELKREFIELDINFRNIVSVTADGASIMIGKKYLICKNTET